MAANPTVPNTFTNGTSADAPQVNANFTTLTAWIAANAMQIDGTVAFTAVPSGPASDPVSANQFARKAYVDALLPPGVTVPYAGASAPSGWLLAQGQAISRTTFAALFAVCGVLYGPGDGSTTFNLPDLRGRHAVGLKAADTDFDVLGETGGQKTFAAHTHTMGNHTHDMTHGHSHTITIPNQGILAWVVQAMGTPGGSVTTAAGPNTATNATISLSGSVLNYNGSTGVPSTNTTDSTGAGANNMNPYIVTNYIIKT